MTVQSMSLRLQSESLSVAELTSVVGAAPTRSAAKGDLMSKRNPRSSRHCVSTWVQKAPDSMLDPDEWVLAIEPLLARLRSPSGSPHAVRDAYTCDLVIAVAGRPMGFIFGLNSQSIKLLAQVGCGVMLDVYCFDDEPGLGGES